MHRSKVPVSLTMVNIFMPALKFRLINQDDCCSKNKPKPRVKLKRRNGLVVGQSVWIQRHLLLPESILDGILDLLFFKSLRSFEGSFHWARAGECGHMNWWWEVFSLAFCLFFGSLSVFSKVKIWSDYFFSPFEFKGSGMHLEDIQLLSECNKLLKHKERM